MSASRLQTLTDGVFAVVMTRLVFEMRVPDLVGTMAGPAAGNYLWGVLACVNPILSLILYALVPVPYVFGWLYCA